MNNVDLFIKYLAGELDEKEAAELERKMEADHLLKQEFEAVSEAWNLVRAQLRKRDENDFKMRLQEVMERSEPVKMKRSALRNRWVYAGLPLAAALALLLVVFTWFRDQDRLVSRYYHPEKDPVILAISDVTRGGAEPGIILYNQGRFGACKREMEQLLLNDPDNRLALLYYLLSSMETGSESLALKKLSSFNGMVGDQVDQAIAWYRALAMMKTGKIKDASALLTTLAGGPGPYRSDARKLLKRVSK